MIHIHALSEACELRPEKPVEAGTYGDRLIEVLNSIDCERIGVILRHSVRDQGKTGEVANPNMTAGLTPHGHGESKRFGRSLPRGFNLVVGYSPVPRCVETAAGIMNGYSHVNAGSISDVGVDDSLAVTHFFAKDTKAMESYREKVGGLPFLREWLDGGLPLGMMKSPSEVKQFVVSSVGKAVVDGLVARPLLIAKDQMIDQEMAQRPQHAVRESEVIPLDVGLVEPHTAQDV